VNSPARHTQSRPYETVANLPIDVRTGYQARPVSEGARLNLLG